MISKTKKHIRKTVWSMQNAIRGIYFATRSERNLRIELTIFLLTIILGVYVQLSYIEFAVVFLAGCSVLGAELLNTAIEESWNKLHPDMHDSVGRIKDIASGGVFIMGFGAALAGTFIFLHHIV